MTRWQIEPLTAWTWPVTRHPKPSSRFSAAWPDTVALLEREVEQLGIKGALAVRAWCKADDIRRDGLLRANASIQRPGVVISFMSKHGPLTYPCDTYRQEWARDMPGWQANVRAIALSLEALRAVDRHGVAGHGEQYTGWRGIEAGPTAPFQSKDEALAWLRRLVDMPIGDARTVLKAAAFKTHPDRNDGETRLWERYDAARQLLEVPS